jgi:hypothetical protein
VEIGVVFPQTEIGADPAVVRAYAAAVAELGYRHIRACDHVLGADTTVHKGWRGPYAIDRHLAALAELAGAVACPAARFGAR